MTATSSDGDRHCHDAFTSHTISRDIAAPYSQGKDYEASYRHYHMGLRVLSPECFDSQFSVGLGNY